MSNDDLISIVMPCFNAGATLERSIRSALGQSYRNIELIIVDDGSKDDSTDIVLKAAKEDSRLTLIESPRNSGAAKARNLGILRAKGDFIAFLDADDTWNREFVALLYHAISKSPESAIAYCGWQNIGASPGRSSPYVPPDYEVVTDSGPNKLERILADCPFPIHAALTRSSIVREEGGFDETLNSCMDFDLWLRIGSNRRMHLVPRVLAYYWHYNRGTQITADRAKIALNHWRVQRKFLDTHPEVAGGLGAEKVRALTHVALFQKGLEAHWRHDLNSSRRIFRALLPYLSRDVRAWKYLAFGIVPQQLYEWIMELLL